MKNEMIVTIEIVTSSKLIEREIKCSSMKKLNDVYEFYEYVDEMCCPECNKDYGRVLICSYPTCCTIIKSLK